MFYRRPSKFKNTKTEYNGRKYDSMGEAGLAQKLDILLKAKELKKVEPQKTFTLYGMNRGKVCSHRVDFFVTYPNGTQEVFEFKGFATAEWRIKYKLFQDNYPHIKYNVVTGNYIAFKSKNRFDNGTHQSTARRNN